MRTVDIKFRKGGRVCKLAKKGKFVGKAYGGAEFVMAKKGLRAWVKENWVDIANKRPDGSYPKCGRSGGEKRKKWIQRMRAYCKSKSDEQRAACGCRKKKTSQSKYWSDTE